MIPLAVKNLRRGLKIKLHNQGTPIRNWLHADDTAEAVLSIIDAGVENEIYNVAGGFEQTNKTTIEKILQEYTGHEDVALEDHVDFSYNRVGQDVRYALNDDKLRLLGWAPQKIFDREIKEIVDYYRNRFIW